LQDIETSATIETITIAAALPKKDVIIDFGSGVG
jgi:hypothetical protein